MCTFTMFKYFNTMAVSFSYRSKKDKAPLEIRFSFTNESILDAKGKPKRLSYYTRSEIEVLKTFWAEYKKGISFKDEAKINLKAKIDKELLELRKHINERFQEQDVSLIDKKWFKKCVQDYYNPPTTPEQPPIRLLQYFDYYLNQNRHKIKGRTLKKWNTIKNKFERFQGFYDTEYKIQDVGEEFMNKWIDYCKADNYAIQTIKKDFSRIKTLCNHAKRKGLEVNPEIEGLVVPINNDEKQASIVYLSFKEIEMIKSVEHLPPYLDNARDWLLISCHTAQRVSDFMRFNKSMLRKVEGKNFIDVQQVKTGKLITIPIYDNVLEILEKRGGEFPRPISDQKYNTYIKEVAKRAGLSKRTKGGIRINNRKIIDEYPKWQLITSHIGRRSFCTNYYGKVPTTYLKDISGHGTEQQLMAYIGKTSKDTAMESYNLIERVNSKRDK